MIQKLFAVFTFTIALMVGVSVPIKAEEPAGLRVMLSTTVAEGNRTSFDSIFTTALKSWPASRLDIIAVGVDLNPDWVPQNLQQELNQYKGELAAAEQRERDRGIWYYVDPKYWAPTAELGAGTSSGDTNEQSIALGLSFKRDFGTKWSHGLNINYDFARRQGLTTRNRLDIIENSSLRTSDNMFLTNFTQFEVDRFSGFDWRITENIGVAYQLLKSDTQSLRLQGGPGVRFSRVEAVFDDDLLLSAAETRTEFTGRIAADYDLKLTDDITLIERAAAVFGTQSIRLDNTLTLAAQINSSLSARLRFGVVYESDVPVGTSNTDTVTRATIVYTF